MDSNNLLKQLLMLGVGTTSMVLEKIKEASDKLVLSKIVYDRNVYNKMKSYLKSSSKENADFFNSLK